LPNCAEGASLRGREMKVRAKVAEVLVLVAAVCELIYDSFTP
jgi:hypothetical protein